MPEKYLIVSDMRRQFKGVLRCFFRSDIMASANIDARPKIREKESLFSACLHQIYQQFLGGSTAILRRRKRKEGEGRKWGASLSTSFLVIFSFCYNRLSLVIMKGIEFNKRSGNISAVAPSRQSAILALLWHKFQTLRSLSAAFEERTWLQYDLS